jgi:hypothetical protein
VSPRLQCKDVVLKLGNYEAVLSWPELFLVGKFEILPDPKDSVNADPVTNFSAVHLFFYLC